MKALALNCTLKRSPGEYLTTDEVEWSNCTGVTAAQNLVGVARALHCRPSPATTSGGRPCARPSR